MTGTSGEYAPVDGSACRDCGSTAQVIRSRQGRERLECIDCGLSTPTSSPLLMEGSDG